MLKKLLYIVHVYFAEDGIQHFVANMTDVSLNEVKYMHNVSRNMRFLTIWYVRPAKPQISLRIRAGRTEPLLVT